jgi:hypothetical protein
MNDKPKSKWYWRLLRWGLICLAVLITLAAVLVTEEDWRGKRAWENYKQEAEARGEHLDWLADATNTVPDNQNFAKAPIIANLNVQAGDEATGTWKFYPYRNDGGPDKGYGNWGQARLTDLAVWQDYYRHPKTNSPLDIQFPIAPQPQTPAADVLLALSIFDKEVEELRSASRRPYSSFGMVNANDPEVTSRMLQSLAAMKRCTQLLNLRAIAELADNQGAKGLDDVELLLRLDDELRQEPTLIAHLVSLACTAIQLQSIYEGLAQHCWNDAQLAELENALAAKDFLADYQKAMRGERAYAWETLENQRLTRKMEQYVVDGTNNPKIVTISLRWTPDAYFYQSELAHARVNEQYCLPLVDLDKRVASPTALRQAEEAVQAELKHYNPYKITALMMFPAISKAVEKFAAAQSQTDLALVACALERHRLAHGGYPDTLEELAPQYIAKLPHDVINGQPLHYRRTPDGLFVLYSLSWNEKDHGGQVALTKSGAIDRKNSDWVWRYPANEK